MISAVRLTSCKPVSMQRMLSIASTKRNRAWAVRSQRELWRWRTPTTQIQSQPLLAVPRTTAALSIQSVDRCRSKRSLPLVAEPSLEIEMVGTRSCCPTRSQRPQWVPSWALGWQPNLRRHSLAKPSSNIPVLVWPSLKASKWSSPRNSNSSSSVLSASQWVPSTCLNLHQTHKTWSPRCVNFSYLFSPRFLFFRMLWLPIKARMAQQLMAWALSSRPTGRIQQPRPRSKA